MAEPSKAGPTPVGPAREFKFIEVKSNNISKSQPKNQAATSSESIVVSTGDGSLQPPKLAPLAPSHAESTSDGVTSGAPSSHKFLAPAGDTIAGRSEKDSTAQEPFQEFTMPKATRPVFPGLMKAPEIPPGKVDSRSTLSTSLAPRSGALPSQPFRHHENTFGRMNSPQLTSPSSVVPTSNPATSPSVSEQYHTITTPSFAPLAPAPPISFSALATPSTMPVSTPTSSNKKHQRSYVLPDGSVATSGKGLGRGRPGIKRGPRKSKLATEIRLETPKPTGDIIIVAPFNKKRKRDTSEDVTTDSDSSTPSESSSRASSEEFIPENTQTRSGRQALKPATFVPSVNSTPTAKRPRLSLSGPPVPKPAALAKIKRKTYRGRENAALCEHCLRGNGPTGNAIVFCDGCNKCWHQRCHEPQISEAVIKDTKADWYCNGCETIINGGKKGGKKSTPKSKPTLSLSLAPATPLPLVGASHLTREQRQAQLLALSKDKLIEMLMRATDLAPALPLFEDPNPPVTTPTSSRPSGMIDSYPTPTQEEEDYGYLYDEHAALYPRPGNGIKLPPESVDLAMLLEGPECKTFSHNLFSNSEQLHEPGKFK